MKNLIFVGGTMGVGKSAVCGYLKKELRRCVFLDGDNVWDMSPFIVNDETKAMSLDNICFLLNSFLKCSEFENIVFCWVMHEESIIKSIVSRLCGEYRFLNISLVCSEIALLSHLEGDIAKGIRTADVIERSLPRLANYYKMDTLKVDVTDISAYTAALKIKEIAEEQQ